MLKKIIIKVKQDGIKYQFRVAGWRLSDAPWSAGLAYL